MSQATGALFLCPATGRILLGLRSKTGDASNTWALFGGGVEEGESLADALRREVWEECGVVRREFEPVHTYNTPAGDFSYITQLCLAESEWEPRLNHEHTDFRWINPNRLPSNMHPQLLQTLNTPRIKALLRQYSNRLRDRDNIQQFVGERLTPDNVLDQVTLASVLKVEAGGLNAVRASKLLEMLGVKGFTLEESGNDVIIFRLNNFQNAVAPLTRFYGGAKNLSDASWAQKRLVWTVAEVGGQVMLQQTGNTAPQLIFRQL